MKSVALIVWLLLPSGHERIALNIHLDDMAACQARAVAEVASLERQGGKARYLCQKVVEEVGEVDANGNPIEP